MPRNILDSKKQEEDFGAGSSVADAIASGRYYYNTSVPAIDVASYGEQEATAEQFMAQQRAEKFFNNMFPLFASAYPNYQPYIGTGVKIDHASLIEEDKKTQLLGWSSGDFEGAKEGQRFEYDEEAAKKWTPMQQIEKAWSLSAGVEWRNNFITGTYLAGGSQPDDYFNKDANMDRNYVNFFMQFMNESYGVAQSLLSNVWSQENEVYAKHYLELRKENPDLTEKQFEEIMARYMSKWKHQQQMNIWNTVYGYSEAFLVGHVPVGSKKTETDLRQKRLDERIEVLKKQLFRPTDPEEDPDYFADIDPDKWEARIRINTSYNNNEYKKIRAQALSEVYGQTNINREQSAKKFDETQNLNWDKSNPYLNPFISQFDDQLTDTQQFLANNLGDLAPEELKNGPDLDTIDTYFKNPDFETVTYNTEEAVENRNKTRANFKEYARNYSALWNAIANDPENEYNNLISDTEWDKIETKFLTDCVVYGTAEANKRLGEHLQNAFADAQSAWAASKGEDYDGPIFDRTAAIRNVVNTFKGFAAYAVSSFITDVEVVTGLGQSFANAVYGELSGAYKDDGMNIFQKTYQNLMEDRYGLFQVMSKGLPAMFGLNDFENVAKDQERFTPLDYAANLMLTGAWSRKRQEEMRNMGLSYNAPMLRTDAGKVFNSNFAMNLGTNMGFMVEMRIGGWAKSVAARAAINYVGKKALRGLRAERAPLAKKLQRMSAAEKAAKETTKKEIAAIDKKVEFVHKAVKTGRTVVAVTEPLNAAWGEAATEAKTVYDEVLTSGFQAVREKANKELLNAANNNLYSNYLQVTFFGDMVMTQGDSKWVPDENGGHVEKTYVDANGNVYTESEARSKFGKEEKAWLGQDGVKYTDSQVRAKAFNDAYNSSNGLSGDNYDAQIDKVLVDAATASTYDCLLNVVLLSVDNGLLGTAMQTQYYKNFLKTNKWARRHLPTWVTNRASINVTWTHDWKRPLLISGDKSSFLRRIIQESTVQGWEEGAQRMMSEGAKASAYHNIGRYIQNIYDGNAPDELGKVYGGFFGETFQAGVSQVISEITNPAFWNEWVIGQASFFLMPGPIQSTSRYNAATDTNEKVFFGRGSIMGRRQKTDADGNLLYIDQNGNETTVETRRKAMENYVAKKESVWSMLNRLSLLKLNVIDIYHATKAENDYNTRVVGFIDEWARDPNNVKRLRDTVAMMQSMSSLEEIANVKANDPDAFQHKEMEALATMGFIMHNISNTKVGRAILDHLEALANMQGEDDADGNFKGDEVAQKELDIVRKAMKDKTMKLGVNDQMTDKQVFDIIKRNAARMLDIINTAKEEVGNIEEAVGRIDETTMQGLVYAKILSKDIKERLDGNDGLRKKVSSIIEKYREYNSHEAIDYDEEGSLTEDEVYYIATEGSIKKAKERRKSLAEQKEKLLEAIDKSKKKVAEERKKKNPNEEEINKELTQRETNVRKVSKLDREMARIDRLSDKHDRPLTISEVLNLDEETRAAYLEYLQKKEQSVKDWDRKRQEAIDEIKKAPRKKGKGRTSSKRVKRDKINEMLERDFPESKRPTLSEQDETILRGLRSLQAQDASIIDDMISVGYLSWQYDELSREYGEAMSDPRSLTRTLNDIQRRAADRQIERLAVQLLKYQKYGDFVRQYERWANEMDDYRRSKLNQYIFKYERDMQLPEKLCYLSRYAELQAQAVNAYDEIAETYAKGGDKAVMEDQIDENDYKRVMTVLTYCVHKGIRILDEGGKLTQEVTELLKNPSPDFLTYYKRLTSEDFKGDQTYKMFEALRTRVNKNVDQREEEVARQNSKPTKITRNPRKPYKKAKAQEEKMLTKADVMFYMEYTGECSKDNQEWATNISAQFTGMKGQISQDVLSFIDKIRMAIVTEDATLLKEINRYIIYYKNIVLPNKKWTADVIEKERETLTQEAVIQELKQLLMTVVILIVDDQNRVNLTKSDIIYMLFTTAKNKENEALFGSKMITKMVTSIVSVLNTILAEKSGSLAFAVDRPQTLLATDRMSAINESANRVADAYVRRLIADLKYDAAMNGSPLLAFDLLQTEQNYEGAMGDRYKKWNIERACNSLQGKVKKADSQKKTIRTRVLFVVDDDLTAEVEKEMNEAYNSGKSKRQYEQDADIPVIAVVVDENGPLTVLINNVNTKVQPIGFVTSPNSRIKKEGDAVIAQNIHKAASRQQSKMNTNKVSEAEKNRKTHLLVDNFVEENGNKIEKPLETILYNVEDRNMDELYETLTVDPTNPNVNVRHLLMRLAVAAAYRGKEAMRKADFNNLMENNVWTKDEVEDSFNNKKLEEILKDYNNPFWQTMWEFCNRLKAHRYGDTSVGESKLSLQYTDTNHDKTNVFVMGMDKTVNRNGDKWIDVLLSNDSNKIVIYNHLTRDFAVKLYEALYGEDNGLVSKLKKAESDEEKKKIVDEWNEECALEKTLNNYIHLARDKHYRIEYNSEDNTVSVRFAIGQDDDYNAIEVTLFSQNLDEEIKSDVSTVANIAANFLKKLLVDEETHGIRELNSTEDSGWSDNCIAHWQCDYGNFGERNVMHTASVRVKNAVVRRMTALVFDGLLYMQTYDLRPGTQTPILYNMYDKTNNALSIDSVKKRIDEMEKKAAEEDEKEREQDDKLHTEVKYKTKDDARKALENVNSEARGHIDFGPFTDRETGKFHLTVTSATVGSSSDFTYTTSDGTTHSSIESSGEIKEETEDGRLCYGGVSRRIGNGIDNFIRLIVQDKIPINTKDYTLYCPNYNNSYLESLADDVRIFIKQQELLGREVMNGVAVYGEVYVKKSDNTLKKVPIVGVLDLVAVDEQGKLYIFDIKTTRTYVSLTTRNSNGEKSDAEKRFIAKMHKYKLQVSLYRTLLVAQGFNVSGNVGIMPIRTYYKTPSGEGGSKVYRANDTDPKSNQLYDENGKKIYLEYAPQMEDVETFGYVNIGTKDNPLIFDKFPENVQQEIEGVKSNPLDIEANAEGEFKEQASKTPDSQTDDMGVDDNTDATPEPKTDEKPVVPESSQPEAPNTTQDFFTDDDLNIIGLENLTWKDITDLMMNIYNETPDVAIAKLSKIKSCAKKVMGDDISDDEFEKEFDKQCYSTDGENNKSQKLKREKIKYCIKP